MRWVLKDIVELKHVVCALQFLHRLDLRRQEVLHARLEELALRR